MKGVHFSSLSVSACCAGNPAGTVSARAPLSHLCAALRGSKPAPTHLQAARAAVGPPVGRAAAAAMATSERGYAASD